jgi:prolyl oligopeptidase
MTHTRNALALIVGIGLFGCAQIGVYPGRPLAAKKPVIDTYHEVQVTDNYRWLEDWNDADVKAWSDGQNKHAREKLDAMPHAAEIRARVKEIVDMMPARYYGLNWSGDMLFALKFAPPANQPMLVIMPSADKPEEERVLLDPNELDSDGGTAIDWYMPSPDGRFVAISMSKGGSESGDLHIFDVESGEKMDVVIPRVHGGTAGGDMAWMPDSTGFYYTRYPRKGERLDEDMDFFQQLWFHQIGRPTEKDRYELGGEFPRIAEIEVDVEPLSGRALATVQDGDGGEFAHYVREIDGRWKQLSQFGDGIIEMTFGPMGDLFLISRHEAPHGKLLHLASTSTPLGQARKLVAEGTETIVSQFYGAQTMLVTDTRVYLTYQLGGPSEIRVFDHGGRQQKKLEIPPVSAIGTNLVRIKEDDILFSRNSYIEPSAWYKVDGKYETVLKTALATEYPIDFSDVEVVREFVISADGARVPLNIIRRKGVKLNAELPVLLNGYGGYGVSRTPRYNPLHRIWFDHGGVYAYANLRGGGEFGEEWHRAGMLTKKQNVFDDFYACIKYLFNEKYTNADKLVIEGGSNGGLLMGAMIAQHPEEVRTVVSHVGIYDMLRVETSPNGSFNVFEYGTVKNEAHFKAMYAYSPYHNLTDGVSYPAVLFMTGANDPRVDPMHSRKMTARMQEATGSSNLVLLRTSSNTGHGLAAPLSERIEQKVDVLTFIFSHLSVPFQGSTSAQ